MITKAQQYLDETEQVTKACFLNIDDFIFPLHRDPIPMFISSHNDDEDAFLSEYSAWHKLNEVSLTRWKENQEAYFKATTSRSFACGFILKIAYNAIFDYSINSEVHSDFIDIISPTQKAAKYCVGRLVRGIPLGLLIYAGRNQFCHATDGKLNAVGQRVFQFLSSRDDNGDQITEVDMCFNLNNTKLHTFAHNIVALSSWKSYNDYIQDMQSFPWA